MLHIRRQELPSVLLMALTHLWGACGTATGWSDDAFLNEIEARRHWRQAEVRDLERVWLRLSSLGKGWGSWWCDWWVLPVSALGDKQRGFWVSDGAVLGKEYKALSLLRWQGWGKAAHLSDQLGRVQGGIAVGCTLVRIKTWVIGLEISTCHLRGGLWNGQTESLSSHLVGRASEKSTLECSVIQCRQMALSPMRRSVTNNAEVHIPLGDLDEKL